LKTLIVPDASVMVRWVFKSPDEPDHERALAILEAWIEGRIEILIPSLWVYELGNIIPRKNPAMAEEIMGLLLGYRLPEQEMNSDLCSAAIGLMKTYGVTFYDAAYHATAINGGGVFVTADTGYLKAVHDRTHAALLSRFSLPGLPYRE
jgi:predicted nucleic acid-binding protein